MLFRSSHVNIHSPLHWGQKYEPLSTMYYEYTYDTKISEYGCIPHPKYPYIGASPDGINTKKNNARYGRMLEIKNVVSRVIDGLPKKEYWIQMQLQMECCNLNECDFLECKFENYPNIEAFLEDGADEVTCNMNKSGCYKGMIIVFFKEDKPIYEYMPFSVHTISMMNRWIKTIMNKNKDLTWVQNEYWKLSKVSCVLVERNRDWFHYVCDEITAFWKVIEYEREHGYEHRKPSKRQKRDKDPNITIIEDNLSGSSSKTTNVVDKNTSNSKKKPSNVLCLEIDI